MLPRTGVLQSAPFTDPAINVPAQLATLHRIVRRADARVRAAERGLVDAEYGTLGVDPAAAIDYTQPAAAQTLGRLVDALERCAPYVAQPAAGTVNPPLAGAHLVTMVQRAVDIFRDVATNAPDGEISAVFTGLTPAELGKVRARFGTAATTLAKLRTDGRILGDRRGDLAAQGAGALTSPASMLLPTDFADAVTDQRVRVLLHESFHAVDAAIVDHAYATSPTFGSLDARHKVLNADHYAHVARTRANLQPPAPPAIVVQADGGVVLTPAQEAMVREGVSEAGRRLTRAWVRSLWSLQRVTAARGGSIKDELVAQQLTRDSETVGMTLHRRAQGGRNDATAPKVLPFPKVTDFDQAVLEEMAKDLHTLVGWQHGLRTVRVGAAAPAAPAAGTLHLTAATVTAADQTYTGVAAAVVDRAVTELADPWLGTPAATRDAVNALRIRDESGKPNE